MEKAIFSITCTTCQARLVVRSEAAIGAILECPKCQSMVHIMPPPGWTPTPTHVEPSLSPAPNSPPPLDRVHAGSLPLDLEPVDTSLLGELSRHLWLTGGATSIIVLAVAWGLWLTLGSRPATGSRPAEIANGGSTASVDPPVKKIDPPAKKADSAATETERLAVKSDRPATDGKLLASAAAGGAVQPPPAPPKPQSGAGPNPSVPQKITPPPSLSTLPPRATAAKPAGTDLFPLLPEETARDAAKTAHPIEIKKLPPAPVDVTARLAGPLRGLEVTDMPLVKAVDLLATVSTTPITLDADAMLQLGVTPHDPISLRLDSTTVGDALQAAVAEHGLAAIVDGGQVIITSPADYRETLRKVRYTVADLTGEDKASVAELAALVRRLVAPESWQSGGGRGTIEPDQGALVVLQTGDVHQQVLVFCEKLRNARQKPLRSHVNPEQFTLVTRLNQARKMLDRPVTANYHQPATLAKILAFLAEAAGIDILVDHAALATAETSDRVETTLTVEKQGLGEALTTLLRPLGLSYRAIGANTIQVTTTEAAEERLELEFYPVGRWLDKGISGPKLADGLKARVAPSTWSDAGGLADACFDPPSRCLIVLQSQPAQALIQRLLAIGPK